jgi:hypothetical protein
MSFSIGLVLNSAAGVVYSSRGTTLASYSYQSSLEAGGCSNNNQGKTKNATGYQVFPNISATTGVSDATLYTTPIGLRVGSEGDDD